MVFDLFKAYFFSKKSGSSVKLMSWLSLSGMAIGVFGLVLVLSVMAGFNENIRERLLSYEPHLVIYTEKSEAELLAALKDTKVETLEALSFEVRDLILRTPMGVFQGASARGVSPQRLQKILEENVTLAPGQTEIADDEIIMNFELARSLGALEGDFIDLIPPETLLRSIDGSLELKQVKLVGTFFSQLSAVENSRLMIYKMGSLLKDSKNVKKGFELLLNDPMNSESAQRALNSAGFENVETWQDRNSSLLMALKLEKLAMTLFLGLSALITSFSMMTVLLLLIHQKRQDMGILMSMGLSRASVRLIFGGIGLLLSLTGVAMGLVPGVLVAWVVDSYPLQIMPSIYEDPYLPAKLDYWLILSVTFFCFLICLLSMLVPVFRISRLTPTKALQALPLD